MKNSLKSIAERNNHSPVFLLIERFTLWSSLIKILYTRGRLNVIDSFMYLVYTSGPRGRLLYNTLFVCAADYSYIHCGRFSILVYETRSHLTVSDTRENWICIQRRNYFLQLREWISHSVYQKFERLIKLILFHFVEEFTTTFCITKLKLGKATHFHLIHAVSGLQIFNFGCVSEWRICKINFNMDILHMCIIVLLPSQAEILLNVNRLCSLHNIE